MKKSLQALTFISKIHSHEYKLSNLSDNSNFGMFTQLSVNRVPLFLSFITCARMQLVRTSAFKFTIHIQKYLQHIPTRCQLGWLSYR